jgi:hypothetical protein
MNHLELALEKMPLVFSSNKYSKKCKQLGYPEELIRGGNLGRFLHEHCIQVNSRRIWQKGKAAVIQKPNNNVEQAIMLLKAEGYKISKQVIDWKEI